MRNTSMKTNRRPQRGPATHANTERREKNPASRLSKFRLEEAFFMSACLCLAEGVVCVSVPVCLLLM